MIEQFYAYCYCGWIFQENTLEDLKEAINSHKGHVKMGIPIKFCKLPKMQIKYREGNFLYYQRNFESYSDINKFSLKW
jgi:hypothetical protein